MKWLSSSWAYAFGCQFVSLTRCSKRAFFFSSFDAGFLELERSMVMPLTPPSMSR